MKRTLIIIALFAIMLSACAVNAPTDTNSEQSNSTISEASIELNENDNISEKVSDAEESDTASTPSEESEPDNIIGNTPDTDTSDIENVQHCEKIGNTYELWSRFVAAETQTHETLLDLSKISSYFNVDCFVSREDHYVMSCWGGILRVFPLKTDEEKAKQPYWLYDSPGTTKTIVTDIEEYNKLGMYVDDYVYKYTKEGVDIYLSTDIGRNYIFNYTLSFGIGDYHFEVNAATDMYFVLDDGIPTTYEAILPSAELYEKNKPRFEGNMGFYEIGYIYDDKSEVIRILKELVAAAEQGDHVTE